MFLVKQNDLTLDARSNHKQKSCPSHIHKFNLFNENCGKLSYHSHSDLVGSSPTNENIKFFRRIQIYFCS